MRAEELPAGVLEMRERGEGWARWVDGLPRRVSDLLEEWELTRDGEPMNGFCSLVVPVVQADGEQAVLKLHTDEDAEESDHEHLALQHWHGDGTVLLLRADPRRRALLLERLHTRNLETIPDDEACEVVADLYQRIHVPALPQLRPLTHFIERWAADLDALPLDAPIPRRMREQCLSLARDLVTDPASTGVIIHGDLHGQNVLAGDREPWLVIDPKPMSGDPHYEPAPMLWNRIQEEQRAGGDLRGLLRRRFHALVDRGGLDEDRARAWVVVRMVLNASWAVIDAGDGVLDNDDQDWITTCVTIAKAVQD
jgi:streptomycin 6-kinase